MSLETIVTHDIYCTGNKKILKIAGNTRNIKQLKVYKQFVKQFALIKPFLCLKVKANEEIAENRSDWRVFFFWREVSFRV